MSVPEQIFDFLRKNIGQPWCDDCLTEKLKLARRQQVQPVTATLALFPDRFLRTDTARCSNCQSLDPKLTICAK